MRRRKFDDDDDDDDESPPRKKRKRLYKKILSNNTNTRLLFLHPNPVFMNTVIRTQYTRRRADEDAEKGRGRGGARFCGGV